MSRRSLLILIVGGVATTAAALIPLCSLAQTASTFRFLEKPGDFKVGLKIVEQYDYARTYRTKTDDLGKSFSGEMARPLQTLIWYPAEANLSAPMTVGDYGHLMATETSFDTASTATEDKGWLAGAKASLPSRMWAVRDAPLKVGHYPVIIYAPGFSGSSWQNADLCEFLASHGYVVLATPSLGRNTREMTSDLTGINEQAQDISFLIGYAHTLPNVDMTEVAVVGYSWGGISNLFAASRDSRIDALVALDGSMRYYPGLVKQATNVNPDQMTIPLLFFTQGEITPEEHESFVNSEKANSSGPNVLNEWTHGDLITVHMLGFDHMEFCSMYQRDEESWKGFARDRKADYGREDGALGYALVARYTLNFLNAYLKGDSGARKYLNESPADHGAPRHFMIASDRPAQGIPASFESFRAKLGRAGFDQADAVYAEFRNADPQFSLDDTALEGWCAELIADGHFPEVIAIRKLNIHLHPDSSSAYESLGDAYVNAAQQAAAIDSYKKAVEKDPNNNGVKQKLDQLNSQRTNNQ